MCLAQGHIPTPMGFEDFSILTLAYLFFFIEMALTGYLLAEVLAGGYHSVLTSSFILCSLGFMIPWWPNVSLSVAVRPPRRYSKSSPD